MTTLLRNVRHATRALLRAPGFAFMAVLTLAIGIGASTAVFSVVNSVLLEPLPYPRAEELVSIWHTAPGAPGLLAVSGELRTSPSMYLTYAEQNRVFAAVGLWVGGFASVTGLAEPEEVSILAVTDGRRARLRRCSDAYRRRRHRDGLTERSCSRTTTGSAGSAAMKR
jgi:hypothetical protein